MQASVWNIIASHAISSELEQNNTSPEAASDGRVMLGKAVWSVLQGAVSRTISSVTFSGSSKSLFPPQHRTISSDGEGLKRPESTDGRVTAVTSQGASARSTSLEAQQVFQSMQSSDLVSPTPSSGIQQQLFQVSSCSGQSGLARGHSDSIEVAVSGDWSNPPPSDMQGWFALPRPGPDLYLDRDQLHTLFDCPGHTISESKSDFPEQTISLPSLAPIRVCSEQELRSPSSSGQSSGQSQSAAEAICGFSDGPGQVWVFAGPVKSAARMREKLGEYALEGAPWPLCAQILDPVRASVVCSGPAQILEARSSPSQVVTLKPRPFLFP